MELLSQWGESGFENYVTTMQAEYQRRAAVLQAAVEKVHACFVAIGWFYQTQARASFYLRSYSLFNFLEPDFCNALEHLSDCAFWAIHTGSLDCHEDAFVQACELHAEAVAQDVAVSRIASCCSSAQQLYIGTMK